MLHGKLFKVFLMIVLVVGALGLTACAKKKDEAPIRAGIDSRPEVRSFDAINGSFMLNTRDQLVGIHKDALDKEFLLQGELIEQPIAPNWHSLKSRVVAFKAVGPRLYMMEATHGHTVTNDLPQHFILTSFKIVKEENDAYYFDFNEGMNKLFFMGDWYGSDDKDMGGGQYLGTLTNHFKIQDSFIEKMIMVDNTLSITQIAQVSMPGNPLLGGTDGSTYELRYYLSPYRPDADFKPVAASDYRNFAYFEVAPQILVDQAGTKTYSSKFSTKKPIVYAISANTPVAFRGAVEEGVLYWNKVYGAEILAVKQLTEEDKIVGPHPDHNVIQWVNNPDAGYAYADAQMDPRTGEILHAQIFLASVFAVDGIVSAAKVIKRLENMEKRLQQEVTLKKHHHSLGLQGLSSTPLCHLEIDRAMIRDIRSLVSKNLLSDEAILKMAQAYVRETLAHEVGHTLGLRHNFAGSLAIEFPLADLDNKIVNFLETGDMTMLSPTSSIMDYETFKASIVAGEVIRYFALRHDKEAISNLYKNTSSDDMDIPLFCTDSQADDHGPMLDCRRFDQGRSIFEEAAFDQRYQLTQIPVMFLEKLLIIKTLGGELNQELMRMIPMVVPSFAKGYALRKREFILRAFSKDAKFISLAKKFPNPDSFVQEEMLEAKAHYIDNEVKANGGIEAFIFNLPADYSEKSLRQLRKLLDSKTYASGPTIDKKTWTLSEEEKLAVMAYGKRFFALFEKEYDKANIEILATGLKNPLDLESKASADLAKAMYEQVTHYLFAPGKYSFAERQMILKALQPQNADPLQLWGQEERSKLLLTAQTYYAGLLNGQDITTINVDEYLKTDNTKSKKWLLENRALMREILVMAGL